jgi:predicted DNA-binding transcriptional regulator YafY
LTLEEALALIYGLKLLENQPIFLQSGNEARQKLLDLLPMQLRHEVQNIQKQLTVSNEVTIDYSGKDDLFKKINNAIRSGQCLDMDYYSFSRDQFSERKIDPYRIVFRDGFWYLVAYCHLRNEVRLFRVDRIEELKLTAEYFDTPAEFDLESYLGAAWQMERGQEFTFTVRFKGEAARYVQETHFHPSQALTPDPSPVKNGRGENSNTRDTRSTGDEAIIFTARACGIKSVARWVLQFGKDAEVLEPIELREYVVDQIQGAVKEYRRKDR